MNQIQWNLDRQQACLISEETMDLSFTSQASIGRLHASVVQAPLSYMVPQEERPWNYAFQPPPDTPWENYRNDDRMVEIADARQAPIPTMLDREGFALFDAPTAMSDFDDPDAVIRQYHVEVVELVRQATGAQSVLVFDHLVRKSQVSESTLGFGRATKGVAAGPNGRVHNDYSEMSGRKRFALALGAEAAARFHNRRYCIVNVWRSIRGPVLDAPLAVCDASSVDATDLVVGEVRYPKRNGEIYLLTHSMRHRWSHFSAMDRHEALLFKQYDSQVSGVARFTPHAAFLHPNAPADTPPRESIEVRCLVIY
jgi:hypothetical protein